MKKQINLSIDAPCTENWSNFLPTSNGGFCQSCEKNVVDFTNMNNKEIIDFLSKESGKTCVRLNHHQLTHFSDSKNSGRSMNKYFTRAAMVSILMMSLSQPMFSQHSNPELSARTEQVDLNANSTFIADKKSFTIQGIVTDEGKVALTGVNVYLKSDSQKGTVTDIDGKFKFPAALEEGDILVFSSIGYESKEYVVPANPAASIDIELFYYSEIMGELSVEEVYTEKPSGVRRFWNKVKQVF